MTILLDDWPLLAILVAALVDAGRFEEALAILNPLAQDHPRPPQAH